MINSKEQFNSRIAFMSESYVHVSTVYILKV